MAPFCHLIFNDVNRQQGGFHKSVCDTLSASDFSEQLGTNKSGTLIASNGCVTGKPGLWVSMA